MSKTFATIWSVQQFLTLTVFDIKLPLKTEAVTINDIVTSIILDRMNHLESLIKTKSTWVRFVARCVMILMPLNWIHVINSSSCVELSHINMHIAWQCNARCSSCERNKTELFKCLISSVAEWQVKLPHLFCC